MTSPPSDAGSCALRVTIGTGASEDFVPLVDGDTVEATIGEQGLLMMWLSLEIEGTSSDRVDVVWHTAVVDTGIAVEQHDRYAPVVLTGADTGVVENWILFFEGAQAPSLVGHLVDVDVVVRADTCVGAAHVRVLPR